MSTAPWPAGDSSCGRLRLHPLFSRFLQLGPLPLEELSGSAAASCTPPCFRLFVRAALAVLAVEALGARIWEAGSRSFSALAPRDVQSPDCWAVLIMESRSMRMVPGTDFGMCLCVGTVIERVLVKSMGSSASSLLLHVALVSSSPSLISSASMPRLFSRSGCRSSILGHSVCETCGVRGQNCCGWVAVGCPLGGVRRGVGGVRGAHGIVRKGVSCTPEHMIASTGPQGSACKKAGCGRQEVWDPLIAVGGMVSSAVAVKAVLVH